MKTCILRIDQKGKFEVCDMYSDGQLIISMAHRTSLTLVRLGQELIIESDLGLMSSAYDLQTICNIDMNKGTYAEAVMMAPQFMEMVKSFDCHFHIKKFVDHYNHAGSTVSAGLFGPERLDQAWVNLRRGEDGRSVDNIEFSVFRAKRQDNYGESEELDEPAMTLVGSLKLNGQKPHYFLFVTWWGDNRWVYGKNFFYNNTKFPEMEREVVHP